MQCRYNTQFFPKCSQNTSHSLPVRARYGVSFVCSNSCLYLASVIVVIHAISCYIGPRYNGTRLYISRLFHEFQQKKWPTKHIFPDIYLHLQECGRYHNIPFAIACCLSLWHSIFITDICTAYFSLVNVRNSCNKFMTCRNVFTCKITGLPVNLEKSRKIAI